MAEREDELKGLLMKVNEGSEKTGLNSRSWHLVPSLHGKWEAVEIVTDFILLGSKITVDGDCSREVKRRSLEGKQWQT